MKNLILIIGLMLATFAAGAQSFQPLNGNFESWDGTAVDAEPTHWNSFATSTGSYASLASSPHHYHRRNNGGSNSYLTIYTKSIMGIKANGNMTTGRIHAGAMSASSSSNYNYTERANSNFSQPFTATPDSMYVKVSFYASSSSSEAQITAYVHGDNDFQDPNDDGTASKYAARARANTTRTTSSASNMSWKQLKVPFVYSGTATPAYLLISLTTNKTPGGGSGNDSLSVDDIEFVYSSWLRDIKINGESLAGFQKGVTFYDLGRWDDTLQFAIEALAEVADAQVEMDSTITIVDADTGDEIYDVEYVYTIRVTAEDGTTHTYTVKRYVHVGEEGEEPYDGIGTISKSTIVLAPNPAHSRVEILSPDNGMAYQLIDLQGHKLAEYESATRYIDLRDLPTGVYLLRRGANVVRIVKN